MSIYQFLIAVRQTDGQQLMNEAGETTRYVSDITQLISRKSSNGIILPDNSNGGKWLAKRYARRTEATAAIEEAKETGTAAEVDKFSRRTVKVTKQHNDECKRLLQLMGIPYIDAPCEAEAQCAALAKAGKVYAAASEDMDTLCYEAPVLLRHLTFSEQRKLPITEITYQKVIEGLEMPYAQFVDLCILLGCDYCEPIKGIGPTTALKLIREHKTLEKVLENMDKSKYPLPEPWPYQDARELFMKPDIVDPETVELKWEPPRTEELVDFLVKEKGFNEDRVRNNAIKLGKEVNKKQQRRLENFFAPMEDSTDTAAAKKRRREGAGGKNKSTSTKRKKSTVGKKNGVSTPAAAGEKVNE
ncbi:Flap endonuclease 1 [Neolecta irregularis DAH-3]|uniref:Flap endonuclease 1 n=1 Tax=Neolecta irregularis (strain DAH-3) TaxID=1198029 RepID=A0A1U7LHW3_NEOID|nr:Flap endonuclease 1 [Neolecta irregularis DAH-3]|eukprot:OLL22218.1 Flap endonuclease 1 [Neolecta irregularis DAH-3]